MAMSRMPPAKSRRSVRLGKSDHFDLQIGVAFARDASGTKVFQRIADTVDRHDDDQSLSPPHLQEALEP
jgi:hypothetical protein